MVDKVRTDVLQLRALGGVVQSPNILSDGAVNIQAAPGDLINIFSNLDMNDNEILNTILQKLFYEGLSSRSLTLTDFLNRPLETILESGDVHLVPAGAGAGFLAVSGRN